jgi:hypothetical protein
VNLPELQQRFAAHDAAACWKLVAPELDGRLKSTRTDLPSHVRRGSTPLYAYFEFRWVEPLLPANEEVVTVFIDTDALVIGLWEQSVRTGEPVHYHRIGDQLLITHRTRATGTGIAYTWFGVVRAPQPGAQAGWTACEHWYSAAEEGAEWTPLLSDGLKLTFPAARQLVEDDMHRHVRWNCEHEITLSEGQMRIRRIGTVALATDRDEASFQDGSSRPGERLTVNETYKFRKEGVRLISGGVPSSNSR